MASIDTSLDGIYEGERPFRDGLPGFFYSALCRVVGLSHTPISGSLSLSLSGWFPLPPVACAQASESIREGFTSASVLTELDERLNRHTQLLGQIKGVHIATEAVYAPYVTWHTLLLSITVFDLWPS